MTEHLDNIPCYMIEHLKECSICGEEFARLLQKIHEHTPKDKKP